MTTPHFPSPHVWPLPLGPVSEFPGPHASARLGAVCLSPSDPCHRAQCLLGPSSPCERQGFILLGPENALPHVCTASSLPVHPWRALGLRPRRGRRERRFSEHRVPVSVRAGVWVSSGKCAEVPSLGPSLALVVAFVLKSVWSTVRIAAPAFLLVSIFMKHLSPPFYPGYIAVRWKEPRHLLAGAA